jgi:hypothetical protein
MCLLRTGTTHITRVISGFDAPHNSVPSLEYNAGETTHAEGEKSHVTKEHLLSFNGFICR